MADEVQLKILKQGVEVWNSWRQDNRGQNAVLSNAEFRGADLSGIDFRMADLRNSLLIDVDLRNSDLNEAKFVGAHLVRTRLNGAKLHNANLGGLDLSGIDFRMADLRNSDLRSANLERANLENVDLANTNLTRTSFKSANLVSAALEGANLNGTNLWGADLSGAKLSGTTFNNVDLSNTNGLDLCFHKRPSGVDYRTLQKSKNVPFGFWRGCGLPDALIDYMPSLTGEVIQLYSCFISYSSKDQEFADRLHADLQNAGVRCWFAPHDMRTGDRIRDTIDEQIRVHEKLLLILSESSVASHWVDNEVESAMEKEKDRETVLFPVRIDEAIENSDVAWARAVKRTRHTTDFSGWKDHDAYRVAFSRLLRDLEVQG